MFKQQQTQEMRRDVVHTEYKSYMQTFQQQDFLLLPQVHISVTAHQKNWPLIFVAHKTSLS